VLIFGKLRQPRDAEFVFILGMLVSIGAGILSSVITRVSQSPSNCCTLRCLRKDWKHIPIADLRRFLIDLPVNPWPYGRVIRERLIGPAVATEDWVRREQQDRTRVAAILKDLNIPVEWRRLVRVGQIGHPEPASTAQAATPENFPVQPFSNPGRLSGGFGNPRSRSTLNARWRKSPAEDSDHSHVSRL